LDGAQSGLWWEMLRVIRMVRPRWVVVENVAALLNRGMGTVVGSLAESGYRVEWDCIPASAIGAPHRRDRVWIVAHANSEGQPDMPVDDKRALSRPMGPHGGGTDVGKRAVDVADANLEGLEIGQGQRSDSCEERQAVERAGRGIPKRVDGLEDAPDAERLPRAQQRKDGRVGGEWEPIPWDEGGQWAVEPDVGRVANGVPKRVDRLKGLGNAIVPQIAEYIGRQIMAADTNGNGGSA
jgi:DNA (cytosine-5)-methyltransferase 1